MNKKELIEALAEKTGASKKDAGECLNSLIEVISKTIKKGQTVEIAGFGKFEVKKRAARKGVNPKTGEKIKIAASKVPSFKAAKALKDLVK